MIRGAARYICLLVGTIVLLSGQSQAQDDRLTSAIAARGQLCPLPPGAVKIDGYLGKRIDQCIHNRIMLQETDSLVGLFQTRGTNPGGYLGEFIGKWLAAAALSCRYVPNPSLQQKAAKATEGLAKSRSVTGYISTYKPQDEFRVWDVWIQKYVLLGLIAQCDQTGNSTYLDAARRSADHLIGLHGPGKLNIEEYGPAVHKGGCNYCILEPIALLYERSGDKRYLDFANYIVGLWSNPSKYTKNGVRLLENAEKGVPVVQGEVLHSYAFMSCFEGVCELYRATGNKRYLDASVKLAHGLMRDELMITGSVSNHEMWYNGSLEQTELLEKPVETCATATWMKFCYQLLRLTGDPKWADQMEISLYNALLGAMMPRGEWWSYESPLIGERVPSRQQGLSLSCCVSSGPRGLLITPQWGVMTSAAGEPVINLYSEGTAAFRLRNGAEVKIIQETGYPVTDLITFTVQPEQTSSFTLKLRIPMWSKQTVLEVNGEQVACKPGTYASIKRMWKEDDKVTLKLDLRGRIIRAPSGAPQQAIMRGPVVLAFDNRLVAQEDTTVWLLPQPLSYEGPKGREYVLPKHNYPPAGQDGYIDLKPLSPKDNSILMAFEVPFFQRLAHFGGHRPKALTMCDYASAGNQWNEDNLYRVWIPQPLFMGALYARNTWKIMLPGAKERPTVPEYIQKAIGKADEHLPQRLEVVRDVCVYKPSDEYGGGVPKLVRTDKGIVIEFLTQNLAALKAGLEKHPHFSPVSEKRWALSTDEGATWNVSGTPPSIGKILDVGQMCGTMMPDGGRLQVSWEYKKGTRQRLPTVGRIHRDSLDKPIWEEHLPVLQNALMHSIKPHPQGGFLAAAYGGGVRIFRGSKDGKEWKEISQVKAPHPFGFSEADLTVYEDGRTVLLMRADWDKRRDPTPPPEVGTAGWVEHGSYGYYLYQSDSIDFGQTWSEPRRLPIWGHPPYMLKLKSGNLLMVYGHRRSPYSVRAILSHDRGKTWDMDSMLTLHTFDPGNWDLGYPVAMQLDDGRILVSFYGYTSSDTTLFYSPNGQFCTTIKEVN